MNIGKLVPESLRGARLLRPAAPLVLAFAVLAAPFYFAPFRVFQLTMLLVYAVALIGLNLLMGHGGQISLGHGAFMAGGAYTTAIMIDRFHMAYPATLPVAAAGCFLLGLGFGVPALRLKGHSLALVTLSLAIFLPPLLKRFESVTGGSMGMVVGKPQPPAWSGLAEDQWMYFLALALALVSVLVARNLLRSRVGRALCAIRDSQTAAETVGVRLSSYKTLAFAWSAMFAGAAGCLHTWAVGFVSPDSFTIELSVMLLAGLVVGGLGSLYGPLIGATFVVYMPNIAQGVNEAAPGVVSGLLIIITMYAAPTGLTGLARRARNADWRRFLRTRRTPPSGPVTGPRPSAAPDPEPVGTAPSMGKG